jgi:hypothetical protein
LTLILVEIVVTRELRKLLSTSAQRIDKWEERGGEERRKKKPALVYQKSIFLLFNPA